MDSDRYPTDNLNCVKLSPDTKYDKGKEKSFLEFEYLIFKMRNLEFLTIVIHIEEFLVTILEYFDDNTA